MRTAKIIFLTLLLCTLASARSVVDGFCETGAQRVFTQGVQSSTYVQRSNPSCVVTVFLSDGVTKATVFANFGGSSLTNPFTASSTGYFFFWADEGQYVVQLSGSTVGAPVTRQAAVGSVGSGGLLAANNLSDLNNFATSRMNLGLGGAAVLNVGTTAGTVAAGDDSRFPTTGEAAALAGSSGTPGSMNLYVTQADTTTTPTAGAVPRANGSGQFAAGWLNYSGQFGTSSQPGFISAADWITFNAKQTAGSYITALTGDCTAAGPGSVPCTIAANAVTLAKFQQIATASILGRNTAGTGNVEVLTTLPAAIQLNITQLGTLTAGSIPFSLITGAPSTTNAQADGMTKGVVAFAAAGNFTCTSGVCDLLFTTGQKATTSQSGFLSATDWNTFNGKQAAGSYITALTGDCTATGPGSVALTCNNIPTGVTMGGRILCSEIAAPSTPAAGKGNIYCDSTSKNLAIKDESGIIKHGIQTKAVVTNNFVTAVDDDGTVHVAAPITAQTGAPGKAIGSITAAGVSSLVVTPAYIHLLCTGTATSSATLYIKQYGSSACTNTTETTTVGAEILVEHAGFIQNLRAFAGTAGVGSTSGTIFIGIVGTGNTTVTCIIGTGTTCSDTTHSVAVTAGQRLYVQMTTPGSETLADVLVAYEY